MPRRPCGGAASSRTFAAAANRRSPGGARGKPRRWVVERTNAWHNRFRGLLIRWERKAENYLALVRLACGLIAWQQA
jgi:transposase